MSEHDHVWGPVGIAYLTGNPYRRCIVEDCKFISLDLEEDDEE